MLDCALSSNGIKTELAFCNGSIRHDPALLPDAQMYPGPIRHQSVIWTAE
jgi:hypothetical protein